MKAATTPRIPARSRLDGERRMVIRGVDWDDYVVLVDSLVEGSPLRVAYDGKDMEIMTKGKDHERFCDLLHQFIITIAQVQGCPIEPYGQTTWRQFQVRRGLESDHWYFFDVRKREQLARDGRRARGLPSPDLAIEIYISPSEVDRPGIYAALGVVEVWRFDGDEAVIERLGAGGRYEPQDTSGWLGVTPSEIVRWIVKEDTTEFIPWLNRVTRWARRRFARRRGT
jgi:Uma2 family endonuclease